MTNEEKALEIYNRETDKGFHLGTHSLVEMAEWKDQQLKSFLDKRIDECISRMNSIPWYRLIRHFKLSRELYELSLIMEHFDLDELQ